MSKLFSKIIKMCFYILIVTLFLSGTKVEENPQRSSIDSYNYTIEVSGGLSDHLSGDMEFVNSVTTNSSGIPYSNLKLKFKTEDKTSQHSMEFLISKENIKQILQVGTYKILDDKKGLLNYFDGVFGYVNIEAIGELPLFARSGKIKISRLSNIEIEGSLDMKLSNADGQSVRIKGNFKAKR